MGDRPQAQQSLGRYHVGEPLGGGPTGEVFRAKVVGVAGYERQYALKRFHAALAADAVTAEILSSAARSYATITHPHIARLSEYGVAQGVSFVAVELVNGIDVARLLSGSAGVGDPVPRGAILALVAQIARGVAYAHARGVIHLGICPTNVLISTDGDPKVTDFGLLRSRLRVKPPDDPTLVARLPYLAPEQLEGTTGSELADVFQLASLAYELLLGERAFTGRSNAEITANILATPPPARDLPGPVWEVLARGFAPDPAARWSTAGAFADAFDAVVRKLALPGGRADLAAAVKRAQARTADMLAGNASGALSFPLPAPPPSTPGVALSSLFPDGQIPRRVRNTLNAVVVPPAASSSSSSPALGLGLAATAAVSPRPVGVPPPVPAAARESTRPRSEPITLTGGGHAAPPRLPDPEPERDREPERTPEPVRDLHPPPPTMLPPPPAPIGRPSKRGFSLPPPDDAAPPIALPARRSSSLWPLVVVTVAALLGGGYLLWDQVVGTAPTPPLDAPVRVAAPPPDAGTRAVTVTVADSGTVTVTVTTADSGTVTSAVPARPDAGPAVAVAIASPPDAPPPPPPPPPVAANHTTAPAGKLIVTTTPAGAEVFLDGAAKGKTPLELPASGDKHKLALFLPGHKLALADINGDGRTDVTLEKVEKLRGPAGIKIKCSTRGQLYITVDGKDTGLMCPTERLAVGLGTHTVGSYDPTTEQQSSQKVDVKQTHFSVRVTVP